MNNHRVAPIARLCSCTAIVVLFAMSFVGCKRKINQDDVMNKMQFGMSRAEVEAILGPGKDVPPPHIGAGIVDGKPVLDVSAVAHVEKEEWDDGTTTASVVYIDNKTAEHGTRTSPHH